MPYLGKHEDNTAMPMAQFLRTRPEWCVKCGSRLREQYQNESVCMICGKHHYLRVPVVRCYR